MTYEQQLTENNASTHKHATMMEGLDSNILSANGISHLVVRSKNTHQIENDTDTVLCVHQSLGTCHGKKNQQLFLQSASSIVPHTTRTRSPHPSPATLPPRTRSHPILLHHARSHLVHHHFPLPHHVFHPSSPTSPVRMKKPNRGIGGGCGSTEAGAAPVLPTCTRLFSGRSWGTGDLRLNTCQLVVSVLSSPCHVGVSESGQNQKSQRKKFIWWAFSRQEWSFPQH